MSGVENGGISFGKNQNINFDNFNGIQKKDFDKAGGGHSLNLFSQNMTKTKIMF